MDHTDHLAIHVMQENQADLARIQVLPNRLLCPFGRRGGNCGANQAKPENLKPY